MTEVSNEERMKRIWKQLNKHGIYTKEEAYKAYREVPRINITPMVAPIDWDELNRIKEELFGKADKGAENERL